MRAGLSSRPFRLLAGQEGERLYGLAEPHIVGEHTAEAGIAQEIEPGEAVALIGAKLCLECARRLHGSQRMAASVSELIAQFDQPLRARCPGDASRFGRECRQRRSFRAVQPYLAVAEAGSARADQFQQRGQDRGKSCAGQRQKPAVGKRVVKLQLLQQRSQRGASFRRCVSRRFSAAAWPGCPRVAIRD